MYVRTDVLYCRNGVEWNGYCMILSCHVMLCYLMSMWTWDMRLVSVAAQHRWPVWHPGCFVFTEAQVGSQVRWRNQTHHLGPDFVGIFCGNLPDIAIIGMESLWDLNIKHGDSGGFFRIPRPNRAFFQARDSDRSPANITNKSWNIGVGDHVHPWITQYGTILILLLYDQCDIQSDFIIYIS